MARVVIIGGGAIGASVAYHAAARGVRDVILLEREPALATGSTGRSVGGIRHQFSSAVNIRLSQLSVAKFKAFEEEVGAAAFHWVGYLFLLDSESDAADFRRNVALQNLLGVPTDVLTPQEARALIPQLNVGDILAATYCRLDGFGDPSAVTLGYGQAARRLGVEIRTGVEVTGIRSTKGAVSAVETNSGVIEAEWVVNAAGPFAATVSSMAGVALPIEPLRRQVFVTEPFDGLPPSHPMVIDFGTSFYFRREGPGVLLGMTDKDETASFRTHWNAEWRDKVIAQAVRRAPVLAEARIARGWGGLYDTTPDANPILGPVPGMANFLIAAGFSGHGFMHSPATGLLIAEMICGEPPSLDVSELGIARFADGSVTAERNVI